MKYISGQQDRFGDLFSLSVKLTKKGRFLQPSNNTSVMKTLFGHTAYATHNRAGLFYSFVQV